MTEMTKEDIEAAEAEAAEAEALMLEAIERDSEQSQETQPKNIAKEPKKDDPYDKFHMFFPKHINQGLNSRADRNIKNALLKSFGDDSIKFINQTYTERCMYYELPHPSILPKRLYDDDPNSIFEDILMTITENDNKLKFDMITDLVDLKHIVNDLYYPMDNSILRVSYNKYDVYQVKIEDELYYFLNGIITKISGSFYLIGQLPTRPSTSDEKLLSGCLEDFNNIYGNINMSKVSPKHKGTLSNLPDEAIEELKDKYNNRVLYDVFRIFPENIMDTIPQSDPKNKPKLLRHAVYRPFLGALRTTFGEMTDNDSIVFNSCGIFVIRKEGEGYKFSKLLLQGCRFCNVAIDKNVTGGANDKSKETSNKTFRKRAFKRKASKMFFTTEEVERMNKYLSEYTKYHDEITISEYVQKTYDVKNISESLNDSFKTYQKLFTRIQSKIFSVYPVKKDDKTNFVCNSFMDFVLFLFSLVPSTKIHQKYLTRCEGTTAYDNSLEILLSNILDELLRSNPNILNMFHELDDFYEYIRTIGSIFDE